MFNFNNKIIDNNIKNIIKRNNLELVNKYKNKKDVLLITSHFNPLSFTIYTTFSVFLTLLFKKLTI